MTIKPWWDELDLRDEVLSGAGQVDDVQMSLFSAIKGTVPYSKAAYYGEITHPTADLVALIGKVAVRVGVAGKGSEQAKAVWRLNQGMGGGKSHGLVGIWHMAEHTDEFMQTEIGQRAMESARSLAGTWSVADDLQRPLCVVLSCDNMTPGQPDVAVDGPAVTLGERCLWRLVERDGAQFERYRELVNSTNKEVIKEAIESSGRPVVILIDEVMDYLRVAAATDEALLARDMAFLRGLLDSANEAKNCVVVMVMIASENDTIQLGAEGQAAREELNGLLVRNGQDVAVTGGGDFADIIRRRLFANEPSQEVLSGTATEFLGIMNGKWKADVLAKAEWAKSGEFAAAVNRCYPFHPSLIDLAEHEWSTHVGFQRVRSTIQIFATTVYTQVKRADAGDWVPALIGVGDLPLSNPDVVNAVLTSGLVEDDKIVASYREISGTEVVDTTDTRGTAREKDLGRTGGFASINPRASERLGTALFLYSVSPRPRGQQGATDMELKAATFVPDAAYQPSEADVVFAELQDPSSGFVTLDSLPGRGGQPGRHYFSTRQTINMLIKAQRAMVSDLDRDQVLADRAWELVKTGPFNTTVRVETPPDTDNQTLVQVLAAAGIDDARKTRLVVLDPRRFSLLNGSDQETRSAVRAALGLGDEKLPVAWASSAIFVCVNTQRRSQARNVASEYEARRRVAALDAVRSDNDMKEKANQEVKDAKERLDKAIRAAFQHVIYLAEGTDGSRVEETIRFDGDNETALHGDQVWAALCGKDKAFGQGEFNTQALLHQLKGSDLGKPLEEVRDAFWNTPRLPLLQSGESELRAAIYGAVKNGDLALTDGAGNPYSAHSEIEINLQSNSIRLVQPGAATAITVPNVVGMSMADATAALTAAGLAATGTGDGTVVSQNPVAGTKSKEGDVVHVIASSGPAPTPIPTEFQVKISTITSIDDQSHRNALRLLLTQIANAIDGGASHIQLSAEVSVGEGAKQSLEQAAQGANAAVTVTDL
jgi:PASTA domain/Protein of unknown function (DUF499)